MEVKLSREMANYLQQLLGSGEFESIEEVVQDALQLHQANRLKRLAGLKEQIDEGWNAPLSPRTVQDVIEDNLF